MRCRGEVEPLPPAPQPPSAAAQAQECYSEGAGPDSLQRDALQLHAGPTSLEFLTGT